MKITRIILGFVLGIEAGTFQLGGDALAVIPNNQCSAFPQASRPEPMEPLAQLGRERRVRAKGTHQCQSSSDIGHSCVVTGQFTECNEAAFKLKQQDCCPSTTRREKNGQTRYGGKSIGFTINSCSSF